MGLGNLLWKRAFNTLESELRRRGHYTSTSEDQTRDSPERRTIRVVGADTVVDLYIRDGYWTVDKWIKLAEGWSQSIDGEVVQDRYRLRAGFTDLDSGTSHEVVLDTLEYNFVLPEAGPGHAPDPSASRQPGTPPGPRAVLPEQIVPVASQSTIVEVTAAPSGDRHEDETSEEDDDYDYEDPEDDYAPATAGLTPRAVTHDLQILTFSLSYLMSAGSGNADVIAAWGSMYDATGRRSDGYLMNGYGAMGFFPPEDLRPNRSEDSEPPRFPLSGCELIQWGKPYDVDLDVAGCSTAEGNRLGLFTLHLRVPGHGDLNFSVEHGQYDAEGKGQVVEYMQELLKRLS